MNVGRVLCGAVTTLLIGGSALARGSYHEPDRYNPEHITSLPPNIRATIARECPDPRALHSFAAYSDEDRKIVLHYEHFYCQGHDVFCRADGCLHQVYVLSGGHYRLLRSYYAPN